MTKPPTTSTTLLRAIGGDAQSARWREFVVLYESVMRQFLAAHFPGVPADDIMQETLAALVARMPHYVYSPADKGPFHSYLYGILRNKSVDFLKRRDRATEAERTYAAEAAPAASGQDGTAFDDAVFELALKELLADPSIRGRTKQVFIRVAVNGEKPAAIAEAFGLTRNAVDQIKNRLVAKLQTIAANLRGE